MGHRASISIGVDTQQQNTDGNKASGNQQIEESQNEQMDSSRNDIEQVDSGRNKFGEDRPVEEQNMNKLNLGALNLRQNENKRKRSDSDQAENKEGKTQEKMDEENADEQELAQKKKLVNNRAYKRRSQLVFLSLTVILCLSTYFIIAFFLAMKTFQTAAASIKFLEIIFNKGSCFDSAMNFVRENEIRNESMQMTGVEG